MLEAGSVEIYRAGGSPRRIRFGALPVADPQEETLEAAAARLRATLEEHRWPCTRSPMLRWGRS